MAYSEELNMFTVHHYSPIPILHVYIYIYIYMCIYPYCHKRVDSQFMASSVWHTDLYVYPTFKNLLNRDYCISFCRRGAVAIMPGLSPDRIKASVSAYQSAHGISLPSQNTPQITYARASRARARGTGEAKLASLWSQ